MDKDLLPFHRPDISEAEIAAVVETLRGGWLTTGGQARELEREFTAFVKAPAALAVSSGTAALHLALLACGIGPGDEVFTTPMTFCATAQVIEQVGARPVFVDVEPETLNLDANAVEAALQRSADRVRALLPVHLHGHPCDMKALLSLARQHGLAMIEDAAHALPASWDGNLVGEIPADSGGLPRAVAFSFYATKNLTTAEGGMLTASPELIERARPLALHGIDRDAWRRSGGQGSWYYEVAQAGFKYNLPDLLAALGRAQLQQLPQRQQRRRELARRYQEGLADCPEITLPVERAGTRHAWHVFAIRLQARSGETVEQIAARRARLIEALREEGVGSSVHFIPLHLHPYYRGRYGYQPGDFPVAWREYARMVSLPLFPAMEDGDVDRVVEAVRKSLGRV